MLGSTTITGYIYDADGNRVAKGRITKISDLYTQSGSSLVPAIGCDPSTWTGFQLTEENVLGPSGEVLTQLDGSGNWQRTNVYLSGRLLATYDGTAAQPALHFHLTDPLGTRRMQVSGNIASLGLPERDFQSLPYGNGNAEYSDASTYPTANDTTNNLGSTPLFFTGKERDAESGNDYFGARYYASSMGRWLSPDRLNLTDDRVLNPANTLNKYVYGGNNPLKYTDPDGKDITVFYENSFLSPPGHIMFVAANQQTGDAAAMSWGPVHDSEYGFTPLGSPVNSTASFGLPQTTDELKAQYSSLTISTSPEDAQEVINYIRQLSTSTNPYTLYGANAMNCTTVCRNALKAIGLLPKSNNSWTPAGLWANLFSRYSPSYWKNPAAEFFPSRGADYGNRPSNYDPFDLMALMMKGDSSSVTTTQTNTYIDCSKQTNQGGCQQ